MIVMEKYPWSEIGSNDLCKQVARCQAERIEDWPWGLRRALTGMGHQDTGQIWTDPTHLFTHLLTLGAVGHGVRPCSIRNSLNKFPQNSPGYLVDLM